MGVFFRFTVFTVLLVGLQKLPWDYGPFANGATGDSVTEELLCLSNPCVRGTCETRNGSYICSCPNGIFGTHCERVDYCVNHKCIHGGICVLRKHNYRCRCPQRFHTTYCTYERACVSNPCANGGTCRDHYRGGSVYICYCAEGFIGVNCESAVPNIALNKTVELSTVGQYPGSLAVDGSRKTRRSRGECATTGRGPTPWVSVDLEAEHTISLLRITNTEDHEWGDFADFEITVLPDGEEATASLCTFRTSRIPRKTSALKCSPTPRRGRYVVIKLLSEEEKNLTVCEIEIYEDPCQSSPCANNATCNGDGDLFYCTCDLRHFGELCEYTYEVDSYVKSLGQFDQIASSEAGLEVVDCPVLAEGYFFRDAEGCRKTAFKLGANVFNYANTRCKLLQCSDLFSPTLNQVATGFDIYRLKEYAILNSSLTKYVTKSADHQHIIPGLVYYKDLVATQRASWKAASPDLFPSYIKIVPRRKGVKPSCPSIIIDSSSLSNEHCAEQALALQDIPTVITTRGTLCTAFFCSTDNVQLEHDDKPGAIFQAIDPEASAYNWFWDLKFRQLNLTDVARLRPIPAFQSMDTHVFFNLNFHKDSLVVGWEFYAQNEGTFIATSWKLWSSSRSIYNTTLKCSHLIVVTTPGIQRWIAPMADRCQVEENWVIGVRYLSTATNDAWVVPYHKERTAGSTYASSVGTLMRSASVETPFVSMTRLSSMLVPAIRPLVVITSEYDECAARRPCQNGGNCKTKNIGYSCHCPWASEGTNCENVGYNPCENNPCAHNGTCIPLLSKFECNCPYPFGGDTCKSIKACFSNPCANNGTCIDQKGKFECQCPYPYTGTSCNEVLACVSNPCINNGTCIDQERKFKCQCPYPYIGTSCDDVLACVSNPCINNGTCIDQNGKFKCQCPYPYTGTSCDDVFQCSSNPCQNGGRCLEETNTYKCTCATSFTGSFCEDEMACVSNPCTNNGTCIDQNGLFECQCYYPYKGVYCNNIFKCSSNPCQNGGSCVEETNTYKCTCTPPFTGHFCEDEMACVSNPCTNNGTCIDQNGMFECQCSYPYKGISCNDIFQCSSNPCQNGGHCVEEANTYKCTCATSFTGSFCENEISACASNPCQNEGTCKLDKEDSFQCECQPPAGGTLCEKLRCVEVTLPNEYKSVADPMLLNLASNILIEPTVEDQCRHPPMYEWYYSPVDGSSEPNFSPVPTTFYQNGRSPTLKMDSTWLLPGLYVFKVEVANTTISETIFIKASKTNLVALVTGGTTRTVMLNQELSLDGESRSYDPDDRKCSNLTFSWSCKEGDYAQLLNVTEHFPIDTCPSLLHYIYGSSSGTLTFRTLNLRPGKITVRMSVSKGSRNSFFDQVINIVDDFVPSMKIRCVRNCASLVVPSEKLSLTIDCENCASLELSYKWSVDVRNGTEYKTLHLNGSRSSFVIPKNTLQEATFYRIGVVVNCTTCSQILMEQVIYTDIPPFGGTCGAIPPSGEALTTMFIIQCSGWRSGGSLDPSIGASPLKYRFITMSGNDVQLLYFGTLPTSQALPLKVGKAVVDYNRTIEIEIMDPYGCVTSTTIIAQVRPAQVEDTTIKGAISGLDLQNPKSASQYIQSVGSLLNDRVVELPQEDAADLRDGMVKSIGVMAKNINDVDDVILMSDALKATTEVRDEINTDTMSQATEILSSIADNALSLLKNEPESAERVTRAVLPATLNVLYTSKPKTAPVDTTPPLETEAEMQQRLENDVMGPEERAFFERETSAAKKKKRENEQNEAKKAADALLTIKTSMSKAMLETLTAGEDPIVVETDKAKVSVARKSGSELGGAVISSDFTKLSFPSDLSLSEDGDAAIDQSVTSYKENPFTWGDGSEKIGSATTTISFKNASGSEVSLNTKIGVEFKSNVEPPSKTVNMAAMRNNLTMMVYHKVNITTANSAIVLALRPPGDAPVFEVFLRYKKAPDNETYRYHTVVHSSGDSEQPESLIIPGNMTDSTGIYYIGIRPMATEGARRRRSASNSSDSYSLQMATTGCRSWDATKNDWVVSGEVDLSKSSLTKTTCSVKPSPTTTSFAASVVAPPNMIDFNTVWAKFADLKDNAVVFSIIIAIICLYFILLGWSVYKDRKDLERWAVVPLEDDQPEDQYKYIITVETGIGYSSGTTSNVFFTLHGRWGDTGVRALKGLYKPNFSAGSIRTFSFRTPVFLGRINSIKLWHDDSGKFGGGGWFLNKVIVEDKYGDVRSVFTCRKWLDKNADDGRISRIFPVSSREEMKQFKSMYRDTVQKNMTDSHLWLSVFMRPSPSNFTRAQRLTCAVALLFLTMITSAMFYKTEDNVERPMVLKIGPFSISPQELLVSVVSVAICLPPSVLIVQIFRCSNKKRIANLIAPEPMPTAPTQVKEDEWAKIAWGAIDYGSRDKRMSLGLNSVDTIIMEAKKPEEKKKDKEFPICVLYFGWVVAILSIIVPAFFVILYSMEWGAEKANSWMTAYVLSFFESTLVSDPLKVMLIALVVTAILLKSKSSEKEYDNDGKENIPCDDEQSPEFLAKAKKRALLETRARAAVKEIVVHVLFLVLVICITYSAIDSQSYYIHKSISNVILDSFEQKVESFQTFFAWMKTDFVQNYFVFEDVNGVQLHWRERKFMSDRASFRVGPARLRQKRVLPEPSCLTDLINQTCYGTYQTQTENTLDFEPENIRNDTTGNLYLTTNAWSHTPSEKVTGEPLWGHLTSYTGGGFLAALDINRDVSIRIISELQENMWLDRQTRGVFIEFSIYNPNVQLFAFVTVGIEVPNSGGVLRYSDISILRAYSLGFFTIFSYFCLFVVTIYFFVCLVLEIKGIVQQKGAYFRRIINWMNWLILGVIVTMLSLFVLRMVTMASVLSRMNTNLNEYVQFRRVAVYDEAYRTAVAFLATLAILKFIFLLKLNQRIAELLGVLRSSVMPLSSFVLVSFCLLMGFTGLMHIWYRNDIYEMRSPYSTMSTLVAITLGDIDSDRYVQVDPVFSAFSLSVLMVFMNILMLNVLTTILLDGQKSYKDCKQYHSDDHLLAELMIQKLFGGLTSTVKVSQTVNNV